MQVDVSCGVFLIDKETRKILICKFSQYETWSVPKGKNLDGEAYFSTMIRELYQETNISYANLSVEHSLEYEVVKDENNSLKAFIIYIDEDVSSLKLKCHTKVPGKNQFVVEECKWVSIDEASQKLSPSQAEILKFL